MIASLPIAEGTKIRWTNRSVLRFAKSSDPVEALVTKIRDLVFRAFESGWSGPPYDPFAFAGLLGIEVAPSKDVIDAQIITGAGRTLRIEFNPNRSPARINYSVAHELGHSLFPDCAELVRHRLKHSGATPDEWQLEMLCNIAAAEILMPVGTLRRDDLEPNIDRLLELRSQYAVSSEAVLLRILRLTHRKCFGFLARREPDSPSGRYRIDYAVTSRHWDTKISNNPVVPHDSVISQCTAIGHTAKASERWDKESVEWRVEALGIPPYPGRSYPRVLGIVWLPDKDEALGWGITYLKGDATAPRGKGFRILAHIVNDRSMIWGAGFGRAVRRKWPEVQEEFARWVLSHRTEYSLGNVHFSRIDDSLTLAHLVAQHGIGRSRTPRIRYSALELSLRRLADYAAAVGASVHMPRIGTGEAGGAWEIVSEIIEETLCRKKVEVTVYDLPSSAAKQGPKQSILPFS